MTSTLRVVAAVLVMSAVLCGCVSAARVQPCKDWVLYKQCGESWSDHELGTAAGVTICDAGCAMSSVAMSLATYHERIGTKKATPGTLNGFLTSHKGYVDNDLIIWNAIAPLGRLHLTKFVPSLTRKQLVSALDRCDPVIANVRDKTHWVLLVGYDNKKEDTYYVNDPGFLCDAYTRSEMSMFVVYSNSTGAQALGSVEQQDGRAVLPLDADTQSC